jgi:hypothetical protein
MNPIGNVYPIGAYAAEFRRKPMTERAKRAISRALKGKVRLVNSKKEKQKRMALKAVAAGSALAGVGMLSRMANRRSRSEILGDITG